MAAMRVSAGILGLICCILLAGINLLEHQWWLATGAVLAAILMFHTRCQRARRAKRDNQLGPNDA